MTTPLRVLLVEDSEDDVLLILRELRRGGYDTKWERVDTAEALRAAITRQSWDLITCDYVMPQFSGPAALRLIQQHGIDVPIIIVSGEIGEEVAVTAMKAGAHDYVSKHKLTRLVPAIERELREATERHARKHAEEAYRALVEQSPQGLAILQESGVVFANAALARISGYTVEELLAFSPEQMAQAIHPDDRESVARRMQRLFSRGEVPARAESRIFHKNGSLRWIETYATRIEYRGKPALQITYVDITERRRAEAERARLAAAVDQAAESIVITDPDGTLVYVNPACEQMTGYSQAEILGRESYIFGELPQNADVSRERGAALARGEVWRGRETRQRKDGGLYVIEMVVSAVTDTSGRVCNYVGLGREVTERVKRERKVRRSS